MMDGVINFLEQLHHEVWAFVCVLPHEVFEPEDVKIGQIHVFISSLAAEPTDVPIYRHLEIAFETPAAELSRGDRTRESSRLGRRPGGRRLQRRLIRRRGT
jgi:hypothetical protein